MAVVGAIKAFSWEKGDRRASGGGCGAFFVILSEVRA